VHRDMLCNCELHKATKTLTSERTWRPRPWLCGQSGHWPSNLRRRPKRCRCTTSRPWKCACKHQSGRPTPVVEKWSSSRVKSSQVMFAP